jgi:hypothetical protein
MKGVAEDEVEPMLRQRAIWRTWVPRSLAY